MGKNNQNPKNGIALLMVGRNGFQRILITFLWHKMQETSPRAMLQAVKIEIGGRGVPHGCAQMGKNDHNPKIGYALLMVGRKGFLRVFSLDIEQERERENDTLHKIHIL